MRHCRCEFCQLRRRIKRTMKNGSHQQKNRLIQELANSYWNTDFELDYEKCVANGSWPDAVGVLEKRLANAKKIREEKPE